MSRPADYLHRRRLARERAAEELHLIAVAGAVMRPVTTPPAAVASRGYRPIGIVEVLAVDFPRTSGGDDR
jgi:hypothetical protein